MKIFASIIISLFVLTITSCYNPDYLCFEVSTGTTISLEKHGSADPKIQYSFDKQNWIPLDCVVVENNCCVYFKGYNPKGFTTFDNWSDGTNFRGSVSFKVSKPFKCSGNIMTLIDGNGNSKTAIPEYCFYSLFSNCPITDAPQLPSATLSVGCYSKMFEKCTKLTSAPQLPATNLEKECYRSMFSGCSSLTTPPDLPSTTLAEACYAFMFDNCTSLTTAPKLPATILESGCYFNMFHSCTALINPPQLPASTLAAMCYLNMFGDCTSLTTAPQLPATALADGCYSEMFSGCTSLTSAPQLPATTLADGCYCEMFRGCTSLTTAPQLPATKLAIACYEAMFMDCKNIESVTVGFSDWGEVYEKEHGFEGNEEVQWGTNNWFFSVAPSGTFICPKDLPEKRGHNFIPPEWKIDRL